MQFPYPDVGSYVKFTEDTNKPLSIPDGVLYPLVVLARIFILPIACSVLLLVQGIPASWKNVVYLSQLSLNRISK